MAIANSAVAAHKTNDSVVDINPDNAPAVFSRVQAATCSAKYVQIPTDLLIKAAQESDWVVFNMNHGDMRGQGFGQRKRNKLSLAKDSNAALTAAHFVALRPSDNFLAQRNLESRLTFADKIGQVSKDIPRIIVINSHDKTRATQIQAGIFTFVCSNQAIMCSDSFGKWSFRHMNINVEKMIEFFSQIINYCPYILDVRDEMMQIPVNEKQALDFADRIIDLRYKDGTYKIDPNVMIKPANSQQVGHNAWHVFQTVQGNLLKGVTAQVVDTENRKQKSPNRKTREIKDHAKHMQINEGLWKRTVEWLNNDLGRQLPPPPMLVADVK